MYKIEAFLRPNALEKVQEGLAGIGIAGMSVLEVRGFGRQRGHREIYRGAEYAVDFVPKIKIEIVVRENERDQAVSKIAEAAQTGTSATARCSSCRSTRPCASAPGKPGTAPCRSRPGAGDRRRRPPEIHFPAGTQGCSTRVAAALFF